MNILSDDTSEMIQDLVGQFTDLWWATPTTFPDLGSELSPREQIYREKELQPHLDALFNNLRKPPTNPQQTDAVQALVAEVMKSALGLQDRHIQALMDYGFREAIIDFADKARRFDPHVTEEDIYQAARNSTSMNLMQILLGLPVEVTPSVFAFSMLYPYTDNYLDDPAIPADVKRSFNARFRRRLAGEQVSPQNQHEEQINALIHLIEGQFDRPTYPRVYESLLAIHAAQSKSLELVHRKQVSPYEVNVLHTCFEKGGASTLADGYLVAGDLTPPQREFMFYYGVFTQLMDDLEDVHADRQAGILTIFSLSAGRWPLDAITNRTFHFGNRTIEISDHFEAPGLDPIKEILAIAIHPILVDSANCAAAFYTGPYLRTLRRHFPFRYSFLQKERRRFRRKRASLKLLLEGMLMHSLLH